MSSLPPRLSMVALMVEPGAIVADIGPDRGQLVIELVRSGQCPRAIAIEKNPLAAIRLRAEVRRLTLDDRIFVRRGDGLALEPGEADTITIAGLGADVMIRIMASWRIRAPDCEFILQPMSRAARLRRWAAAEGFEFSDERLVRQNRRIYPVIVIRPGSRPYEISAVQAELGPLLIERADPLLGELAASTLRGLRRLLSGSLDNGRIQAARELISSIQRLTGGDGDAGDCSEDGGTD